MEEWMNKGIDVLSRALPFVLGLVGILLLLAFLDGLRTRQRASREDREKRL